MAKTYEYTFDVDAVTTVTSDHPLTESEALELAWENVRNDELEFSDMLQFSDMLHYVPDCSDEFKEE